MLCCMLCATREGHEQNNHPPPSEAKKTKKQNDALARAGQTSGWPNDAQNGDGWQAQRRVLSPTVIILPLAFSAPVRPSIHPPNRTTRHDTAKSCTPVTFPSPLVARSCRFSLHLSPSTNSTICACYRAAVFHPLLPLPVPTCQHFELKK